LLAIVVIVVIGESMHAVKVDIFRLSCATDVVFLRFLVTE
jgi:hypothetical protein